MPLRPLYDRVTEDLGESAVVHYEEQGTGQAHIKVSNTGLDTVELRIPSLFEELPSGCDMALILDAVEDAANGDELHVDAKAYA